MMLIASSDVEHFKISSHGLIKVTRVGSPEEYTAVKPPIKVKLDKDLFVVVDVVPHERMDYDFSITVLKSTDRKFKLDYVQEVFREQFEWNHDRQILWNRRYVA